MSRILGLCFVFSLIFLSCDVPQSIYEHSDLYTTQKPWVYSDSLIYRFNIKDTNRYYNLLLEIDHDKTYSFENLYIKLETLFPDKKAVADVVSMQLADETGAWYSDCRGKACTFYLTLQDQAIFSQQGAYQITLLPWMRSDTIQHIYRIAFKVEKDDKR